MTVLQVRSPGSNERTDCSLTRGVDAEAGSPFNTRDRAIENDGGPILQKRQCLLHRKERSFYIDVEEFVEMLLGDGLKGNKFANARIGENNIDLPLRLRDGFVKTVEVGHFGNVSLHARDAAPNCFYGLVEFFLPAPGDKDERTLLDEKVCRSQTNPFRAPGDDCYLPQQLLTVVHRRLLHLLTQIRLFLHRKLKIRPRFSKERSALIVEGLVLDHPSILRLLSCAFVPCLEHTLLKPTPMPHKHGLDVCVTGLLPSSATVISGKIEQLLHFRAQ